MSEMDRLLAAAARWRADRMAIATVIATWGSSPCPRGSHMLVQEDGSFEGSVSGGCVEGDVLEAAAAVIADGVARVLRFDVLDTDAWRANLPCGGAIEILVQPVADTAFPHALFDALRQARDAGDAITFSTDVPSGKSVVGELPDTFVRHYPPARRLLIVGGVQIAAALAGLVASLDMVATIIDPRARYLTEARFPGVKLDDRWPDDAIRALRPDGATAIVVLSHDAKIDDPALIAALDSPAYYIAALGSRRSHAARLDRLRGQGLSDAQLARIDGPAGLPLGAVGPAEIALSIAAAMIRAWRLG